MFKTVPDITMIVSDRHNSSPAIYTRITPDFELLYLIRKLMRRILRLLMKRMREYLREDCKICVTKN